MTATLKGLEAQIVMPTNVIEYIERARADLAGTDYPGALQLGQALQQILKLEGSTPREIRLFSARYVTALEDYSDLASAAMQEIKHTLGNVDLKQYWD